MASRHERWNTDEIPDQTGRTVVVTGANTGVGLQTARVLSDRGATVVLGCRDPKRGAAAASTISGDTELLTLDLASLQSVRSAATTLAERHHRIDVLVNNAGVMRAPEACTDDGFELHIGTNHLGHFAFTGLVLDLLLDVEGSRVVTVSSPAHKQGSIDPANLGAPVRYRPPAAYARSKLANMLFSLELERRLRNAGGVTIALTAHPGGARTELNRHLPRLFSSPSWGLARPITHSVEKGALSILRAITDPTVKGGDYYGPDGFRQFVGWPTRLQPAPQAQALDVQQRLWETSEQLTGVRYLSSNAPTSG